MVNLRRAVLLLALLLVLTLSLSHGAHQCNHEHHQSNSGSSELSPHGSDQQEFLQAPTHHHHHHESRHHVHGHHDQSPAHYDNEGVLPEELAEEEDLAQHGFRSQGRMFNEQSKLSVVWWSALGCSLLVSTASLICLLLLPFILSNGRPSAAVVDGLAGFGAGCMLGDAFLHQLPHAFGGISHAQHEHSHSNSHHDHGHEVSGAHGHAHSILDLSLGISVLAGIMLFFIVEKLVRYVEDNSDGTEILSSHSHHHHKGSSSAHADNKAEGSNGKEGAAGTNSEGKDDRDESVSDNGEKAAVEEHVTARPTPSGRVLAYLNLFSDGVHNFVDGMALGSAFLLHGSYGGWSRTLFLLAHELPQEVGDFGILVRSGFSVTKALTFNFLSALLAVAGTVMALLLGGNPGHSSLIEGFTAGGFIYISVAGVLPSMHEQGCSLRTSSMQLASLSVGVGVAMAISLAE